LALANTSNAKPGLPKVHANHLYQHAQGSEYCLFCVTKCTGDSAKVRLQWESRLGEDMRSCSVQLELTPARDRPSNHLTTSKSDATRDSRLQLPCNHSPPSAKNPRWISVEVSISVDVPPRTGGMSRARAPQRAAGGQPDSATRPGQTPGSKARTSSPVRPQVTSRSTTSARVSSTTIVPVNGAIGTTTAGLSRARSRRRGRRPGREEPCRAPTSGKRLLGCYVAY